MRKKKVIVEAKDALRVMGGPTSVGRWWGISHSRVCDMGREGHISGKYGLQTYCYLKHLGYAPSPHLFGLKSWDQLYPPARLNGGSKRRAG